MKKKIDPQTEVELQRKKDIKEIDELISLKLRMIHVLTKELAYHYERKHELERPSFSLRMNDIQERMKMKKDN